jgi:hypothetical protein
MIVASLSRRDVSQARLPVWNGLVGKHCERSPRRNGDETWNGAAEQLGCSHGGTSAESHYMYSTRQRARNL